MSYLQMSYDQKERLDTHLNIWLNEREKAETDPAVYIKTLAENVLIVYHCDTSHFDTEGAASRLRGD